MIGDAAWTEYLLTSHEVDAAMFQRRSSDPGYRLSAVQKTPGREAMADARFGLAVFRNEPPLYPVEVTK